MKKFLTTILAAAAIAAPVYAHNGHRGNRVERAEGRRELAQTLNLSDAQKQQIRDIRKAAREQNRPLAESFRAKRAEYRQLRQSNDPRAESVKAELKAMHEQLRAVKTATRERVRSVLTAEQIARLDAYRAAHPRNNRR